MKARRNLIQIWLLCAVMLPAVAQAQFTFVTNNGAITITGYTGDGGDVIIPSATNSLPVTVINDGAFYNCTSLTSVTIPNSVTVIKGRHLSGVVTFGAFEGCSNLTNITIGDSVTNIGSFVFYDCTSLTAITVDANNPAYSSVAGILFDKGQAVLVQYPTGNPSKHYVIPNSVTSIGTNAFEYCTNLTGVIIGNGVTSISRGAFNACVNLTSITIPNGVKKVGDWAFTACGSLTNVMIGSGVTNIGYGAFEVGSSLTSIYFTGNAPSLSSSIMYAGPFYGDTATIYYLPWTAGWGTPFGGLQAVPWLPQAQTSNASFGVQTNQFGFNINWASGQTVVVEACTDLVNPVWFPVGTNTLTDGSSYFSDSQWTNYPGRFYRLRSP